MSENWIKKWYKDSFQKASTEGPKDDVWKNLDSQLEDWTEYWYTSNAETVKGKPSLRVWHNLSRFVESAINERKYARVLRWQNMSIVAIFFMIPFFFVDPVAILNDYAYAFNNSESAEVKDQAAESPIDNTSAYLASNISTGNRGTGNLVSSSGITTTVASIEPMEVKTPSERATDLRPTFNAPTRLPIHSIEPSESIALNRPDPYSSKPMKFSKWSTEGSISFQQTNLLNPTTFKGMSSNSNITNHLSSYIVFNGSISRRLTNRSALKLTASINDTKSQKYMDFVGAEYIEKSLVLNYQTLGISYNYSLFPNLLKGRIGFEVGGGVYGSIRSNITEQWGGEDRNYMMDGFKSFDVGIRAELNSIFALNERVSLKSGLYYSNGVINIFEGVTGIPSHFYRTFTSSFGANVGIRYAL